MLQLHCCQEAIEPITSENRPYEVVYETTATSDTE